MPSIARFAPPRARPTRALVHAIALAAVAALCSAAVALAHAAYEQSTPAQGQVVQTSPARVDIYTAQDMRKAQGAYAIQVQRDDDGRAEQQVDTADTTIDDSNRKHFSVGLQPNLPAGRYLVSFNNVSDEDGEADHGQFAFYVGTGPTAAQKALDAKLQTTSQKETTSSSSHTGLIGGIAGAIVVVLLLVGGGFLFMRRRRSAA
jgi:methionine-rich copper-binding protein CopC